jgi:hypothetical protein
VIAASLDTRDLAMRLDRIPAQLSAALAQAFARFGIPLTIDVSAGAITATLRTARVPSASRASAHNRISYRKGRYGHAKGAKAPRRLNGLRVLRGSVAPFALSDFSFSSASDIRAALEAAAKEALSQ